MRTGARGGYARDFRLRGVGLVLILAAALTGASLSFAGSSPRGTASNWLFTCGSDPFHLNAFEGPTGAEDGDNEPAKALRKALRLYEGHELPKTSWLILTESDELVQFGSAELRRRGASTVDVVPRSDGTGKWGWRNLGGCRPEPLLRERFGTGNWRVRKGKEPNPNSKRIRAWVVERGCASGQSARDRIRPPRVSYGANRIVIVPRIRHPKGNFQTCPGNPRARFTFELDERIGDRSVLDGSVAPFRRRIERLR